VVVLPAVPDPLPSTGTLCLPDRNDLCSRSILARWLGFFRRGRGSPRTSVTTLHPTRGTNQDSGRSVDNLTQELFEAGGALAAYIRVASDRHEPGRESVHAKRNDAMFKRTTILHKV